MPLVCQHGSREDRQVANRQTQTDLSLELTGHIAEARMPADRSMFLNHAVARIVAPSPR